MDIFDEGPRLMGHLTNTPTWGVLVKAPIEQVRKVLAAFGEDLVFRTNDGWTAAFCMEPGDSSGDEAAEQLRVRGYVPIYQFDFSKYEFLTLRWDGERWTLLEKNFAYITPGTVLGEVGIRAPLVHDRVQPREVESHGPIRSRPPRCGGDVGATNQERRGRSIKGRCVGAFTSAW